eukprot:4645917-Karenia_brevis.AAC.1
MPSSVRKSSLPPTGEELQVKISTCMYNSNFNESPLTTTRIRAPRKVRVGGILKLTWNVSLKP